MAHGSSKARRLGIGLAAGALVTGNLMTAPIAGAQDSPADQAPVSTEDLADSSRSQQRWLSVPDSRIVLNPFDSDGEGTELDQTSDATLPLDLGYYASDQAIQADGLLKTYATAGDKPKEPPYHAALSEPFDTAGAWSHHDSTADSHDGVTRVRPEKGEDNGAIEREVDIDDITDTRFLTLDVDDLGDGSTWSLEVTPEGEDPVELQADSSATGEATFDLLDALDPDEKEVSLSISITVEDESEDTDAFADLRSLVVDNGQEMPGAASPASVVEDFSSGDRWKASESDSSVDFSSDGQQASIELGDEDSGAVEREFTVDLDKTPLLSVRTAATSDKWALKIATGDDEDDIEVQADTDETGVRTYDIADALGAGGKQTITIKLFHAGAEGHTVFDGLAFHPGGEWLEEATTYQNEWRPEALTSRGRYSHGHIDAVDTFHDENSFSRSLHTTNDGTVVAGEYDGKASWDPESHVLTVTDKYHTRSIALPKGSEVEFGTSIGELSAAAGDARPAATSRAWTAQLPQGTDSSAIGVGLAVNDEDVSDDPVASARDRALAAAKDPAADQKDMASFWDEYLGTVPRVQDFSVQRVDDGGVAEDAMRHFWFKGWISLKMNLLPATPETGNEHVQLGTGKPSMWMEGTPGTKNVASWDSLLGMQQLVHVDPDAAWDSFQGMMELVEDGSDATEPSDDEYGTRGELGGESLPSRKAQTAWVLYSATGDRNKLESIYDKLSLHLNWERYNMRWVLGENNHFDERDSEFVTSLAYDLEFAAKIADELGHEGDADGYRKVIEDITDKYSEWFFPDGEDDSGKVWDTVQKVYLDADRDEVPFGDDTEGEPFRNEDGQWVRAGYSFYTSTAFVMDDLPETSRKRTMDRFLGDYDEDQQLAGLGDFAVKAPDIQLTTYGLLDMDAVEGSDEADLRDRASVLVNSMNRDMVRSGWFAEVYYAKGDPGDHVGARGVRPSLFGISNYIDFVMMANGVRTDEGDPAFVRLSGATGGVSGLSHMGKALNVDIDGDRIRFSGAAAQGSCGELPAAEGQTVSWADDCGQQGPRKGADA
jgi:hypothetical protein